MKKWLISLFLLLTLPLSAAAKSNIEWSTPVWQTESRFFNVDNQGGVHYVSVDADARITYYRYLNANGEEVFSLEGNANQIIGVDAVDDTILISKHLWEGVYLDLTAYDTKGNKIWNRYFNRTTYVEDFDGERILLRNYPGNSS